MIQWERWKAISGYDGVYEVSNLGRVRSTGRWVEYKDGRSSRYWPAKILKQFVNLPGNKGRLQVGLWKGRKMKTCVVHRLVLLTFVGPCPPDKQCRHLNGNEKDNRLTNLKWGTKAENDADKIRHGKIPRGESQYKAKLTELQVLKIRAMYDKRWRDAAVVGGRFGVCAGTIYDIVHRRTWKHL